MRTCTAGTFVLGLTTSFVVAAGPTQEAVCPADPNDYEIAFGTYDRGEATDLCLAIESHLVVRQKLQISPTVPFIRLETWATTSLVNINRVRVEMQARVTAIVPGGQNGDTMRTSLFDYDTGAFDAPFDIRATDPFEDERINWETDVDPGQYVNDADGEIRVRIDAWDPGTAVNAQWRLFVDLWEVIVDGDLP